MAKKIKVRILEADDELDGGRLIQVPASFMDEFKDALSPNEFEVCVKGNALCYYRGDPKMPSFLVTTLSHRQRKALIKASE